MRFINTAYYLFISCAKLYPYKVPTPLKKHEIEKSTSKFEGLKVFLANKYFRYHQSYHIYGLKFDLKHSKYISDICKNFKIGKKNHPTTICDLTPASEALCGKINFEI